LQNELRSRLDADLKRALRAGEKVKLAVVRANQAAVDKTESDRHKKLVDDAVARGVVGAASSPEIIRQAEQAAREDGESRSRDYYVRLTVMAALDTAEIARQARLEDADVLGVIAKEAKQREESIAAYKAGNRPDLVSQEEAELAVLKGYLPQAANRDDIASATRQVMAEVGAVGPRDKGKVMPRVIAMLRGRADGREINEVVTELLK
jgi:uncharacterized protein YqeY